jgi:hypothetical protein
MQKSPRPKANPFNKPKRPRTRTDKEIDDMADHSIKQGVKYQKAGGKLEMVKNGGKSVPAFAADGVGKMRDGGGMCRGMGSATKGGKYRMG